MLIKNKKIVSLLCLLVLAVSGAFAENYYFKH